MSNTIVNDAASAGAPARRPDDGVAARTQRGDAWHAAFEHALGSSFERWFQAPTPRADGASPGAGTGTSDAAFPERTSTVPSQPAGLFLARAGTLRADGGGNAASRVAGAVPGGGVGAEAPVVSADPAPAAMRRALATALEAWLGRPVAVDAGAVAAEPPPDVGALPPAPPVQGPLHAGGESSGELEAADESASRAAGESAAPHAEDSRDRDPLRVHAEWSDAGVRVWLGADAQGQDQVAAATRQLQEWLSAQGTRLLSVVCNGRSVWPVPGSLRPSPSASDPEPAPGPGRASPALLPITSNATP
ncbi:MAG TPA: hypothetical protein VF457_08470 [Burkholderiaceae bacterium]